MSNIDNVQERLVFVTSTCAQYLNITNYYSPTNWKMLGAYLRYIFYQIRTLKKSNIRQLLMRCDNSAPSPVREIIREVPSQSRTDYSGEMADFRTALQRLREELDRIRKLIQDLTNKGNLSAQDIETLKKLVQQLDQTKADK
ncbi:unnamed protein product, partial [Rotaria magnacalcarata]